MLANKINEYLNKAATAYYEGNPIMSDEAFDALVEFCKYSAIGHTSGRATVGHAAPLYSQQKFYENYPVYDSETVETPKLDGACIALLYIDGTLASAATRGDGTVGEDILEKIWEWQEIPKWVKYKGIFQVEGEVVAPKTIKNARNYAAGALNLKDTKEFLMRELVFVAHGVSLAEFDTYVEEMRFLEENGFKSVLSKEFQFNDYPQDGTVVRINNNKIFESLGYTAQFPRGAYAKKIRKAGIPTTLKEVIWQVGASGKVTPVALFDTIDIEGAAVQRATLHNAGFVEALDLCIGDTILVVRAGEIIPQVLSKI